MSASSGETASDGDAICVVWTLNQPRLLEMAAPAADMGGRQNCGIGSAREQTDGVHDSHTKVPDTSMLHDSYVHNDNR